MFVKRLMIPLMLLVLVIGGLGAAGIAGADDDDHRRGGRFEREHDEDRRERGGTPLPESALYRDECSSCHFLYTPWLLPAASWKRVINESSDHFGDDLALDETTKAGLLEYLTANSTDHTGVRNEWVGKKKAKLLRGVDMNNPPKRITDLKYIKKEHHNVIRKRIYERSSIKTLSNCTACHTTAKTGDFEEDNIKIPK